MHVTDELLLVHHLHLQHELLLDHLRHRGRVLAIPPHLGQTHVGSSAESQEETFLQSAGEVLGDVVIPGADNDRLGVIGAVPAVRGRHRNDCM